MSIWDEFTTTTTTACRLIHSSEGISIRITTAHQRIGQHVNLHHIFTISVHLTNFIVLINSITGKRTVCLDKQEITFLLETEHFDGNG